MLYHNYEKHNLLIIHHNFIKYFHIEHIHHKNLLTFLLFLLSICVIPLIQILYQKFLFMLFFIKMVNQYEMNFFQDNVIN